MKFMKTSNQVVDVMLIDGLTGWRSLLLLLGPMWCFIVRVRLWRGSKDDGLCLWTKHVPDLLGVIWKCMPLFI